MFPSLHSPCQTLPESDSVSRTGLCIDAGASCMNQTSKPKGSTTESQRARRHYDAEFKKAAVEHCARHGRRLERDGGRTGHQLLDLARLGGGGAGGNRSARHATDGQRVGGGSPTAAGRTGPRDLLDHPRGWFGGPPCNPSSAFRSPSKPPPICGRKCGPGTGAGSCPAGSGSVRSCMSPRPRCARPSSSTISSSRAQWTGTVQRGRPERRRVPLPAEFVPGGSIGPVGKK